LHATEGEEREKEKERGRKKKGKLGRPLLNSREGGWE